MAEPNVGRPSGAGLHEVVIQNREKLFVRGVLHVESFDDRQIVLDTELGMLTIQGQELEIRQFDLESGDFAVEGTITALEYSAARPRDARGRGGKGLLDRLLR